MENYCENWAALGVFGGGLGFDGGMAEYMLVPSVRLLVPLGSLRPAKAAPLSDAALTPYHAIQRALPQLNADTTAVVIGVGGLGHMALHRHPVYEALFVATARHLGATIAAVDVAFSLADAEELRTLLRDAGLQRIAITPRSLTMHLPAPERFVQLTVLGAATSIPAFAHLGAAARSALVEAVTGETQAVAQRYRDGNTLTFPMSTHIAVAYTR